MAEYSHHVIVLNPLIALSERRSWASSPKPFPKHRPSCSASKQVCGANRMDIQDATSACRRQISCADFQQCCESTYAPASAAYACQGFGVQVAQCQCFTPLPGGQARQFSDCYQRSSRQCTGNSSTVPNLSSVIAIVIFLFMALSLMQ